MHKSTHGLSRPFGPRWRMSIRYYSTVWNAPFDTQIDVKAPSSLGVLGVLGERLRPGLRALGDGQRLDERLDPDGARAAERGPVPLGLECGT